MIIRRKIATRKNMNIKNIKIHRILMKATVTRRNTKNQLPSVAVIPVTTPIVAANPQTVVIMSEEVST